MSLRGAMVIFDLDGTLVDSAPDLVRALNEVVEADGLPPVPLEDVRQMVGRGSRALLRRAYARQGAALPETALDRRVAAFLKRYARDIAAVSTLFPGAREALDALHAAGARASIATNKPDHLAVQLLEALGVADRFDRIIGADRAPHKKPSGTHLEAAAGSRDALARAVMVGDSATDVAAARDAGAPVIIMSHGYTETAPERLGADTVLSHFDTLPAAASELLAPR